MLICNGLLSIICFVVGNNLLHIPCQSQVILIRSSVSNEGVMSIYINIHMMTNLSMDNYQIWASGEHKRKHIDTKRHTLVQTGMLSLSYICLNSLVMTYQVSLYTKQCCELYMVSQTDNCELYLSSHELIRHARVFFVKNLLRSSYRICCVTRPESIHAVA